MASVETPIQTDYLEQNADNIFFVLGAYALAFFPWAIMNNVDFISEKWRTCRRTRNLARIHVALAIVPVIYVAVYAEAQRRNGDNKEYGAALAALGYNIFHLMRTIMGWVQLNAFVSWCKDAVECIRALEGDDYRSSSSENTERSSMKEKRGMMEIVGQWINVFVSWCEYCLQRMRTVLLRGGRNSSQRGNSDEEKRDPSVTVNVQENDVNGAQETMSPSPVVNEGDKDAKAGAGSNGEVSEQAVESNAKGDEGGDESNRQCDMGSRKAGDEISIENVIMVNNMVVDNELGGRELTVSPSWKKIWRGMKKGRFTPSKWLRTDQAILNTVRWGGAYLCGMGEGWTVDRSSNPRGKESVEKLEAFFSREMEDVRRILQSVEWDVSAENDGHEFLGIGQLGDNSNTVELAGEMSTAYGTGNSSYYVREPSVVSAYSFEFNSLVGSYPKTGKKIRKTANREKIAVELMHSVLVAKHLGVEKLKAIRRYYDRYCPVESTIHNAFKLLLKQTKRRISDDSKICGMFTFSEDVPIFPYRMQMIALWDEATNWRVLQASAHQDIKNSNNFPLYSVTGNKLQELIQRDAQLPVNIFDHCAKWAFDRSGSAGSFARFPRLKGSLGVVLETVRTFLAEWITANAQEPNWKPDWTPDMPTACIEFNSREIPVAKKNGKIFRHYLTWICQRELQRKVAKMSKEKENVPGSSALIMLFILGFPVLRMKVLEDIGVDARDGQDRVREARAASRPNTHCSVDFGVEVWRAWTPLAPQDISLIIQIDKTKGTVALRLQNNCGDGPFVWQDWLDAAMGYMKGLEEAVDGEMGYGRKITRPELGKPMLELCQQRVKGYGIEAKVEMTGTARVWMGWPAFDMRICKFEVDQWFYACGLDIRLAWLYPEVMESIEGVMEAIISAESEEAEKSTHSTDV